MTAKPDDTVEEWTEGPWHREPDNTNIDPQGARHVGTVYAKGWNLALVFADGGIGEKTASANANIMCAAPALYDALRGMLRVCPSERHGMKLAEYQAARAALKLARGET